MDFHLLLMLIFWKIVGKTISKNLSGKTNQKRLDHGKKPTTDLLKTASKRVI